MTTLDDFQLYATKSKILRGDKVADDIIIGIIDQLRDAMLTIAKLQSKENS